MDTPRSVNPLHRLFVILTLLSAAHLAHGITLPPPEQWFSQMGLPWDEASLFRYLEEGFPASAKPVDPRYSEARVPFDRWNQYGVAVELLRDAAGTRAALRRIVEEPLPDLLVNDLLRYIALDWQNWESFDDWDKRSARQAAGFRVGAALELLIWEPKEALEVFPRLLARVQAVVEATLAEGTDAAEDYLLVTRFNILCVNSAMMGRPEGVDGLIALLPSARNALAGSDVILRLQWVTGPRFPISADMPEAEYRDAVRQWQEWWAANRAAFKPPARIWTPPADKPLYTYPPPKGSSKLERVLAYVGSSGSTTRSSIPVLMDPDPRRWLEENAHRYTRQLRRLAEDSALPLDIRWDAARWYVKVGGDSALEWVRRQVLEWIPQAKPSASLEPRQLLQMVLMETPAEKAVAGIARECVEQRRPATPIAVSFLLNSKADPAASRFLLDQYEQLVALFPELRETLAAYFVARPADGDERIFLDVLHSGDRSAAPWAVRAVRDRRLDALPADVRATYERWASDPAVRIEIISRLENREQRDKALIELVRSTNGTDVLSARVYAFGYAALTQGGGAPLTPEARACLDAIDRCIAAYRASDPTRQP